VIGATGGDAVELAAAELELTVTVADAEHAWRSLADRFV
jgi:hypothetical protein